MRSSALKLFQHAACSLEPTPQDPFLHRQDMCRDPHAEHPTSCDRIIACHRRSGLSVQAPTGDPMAEANLASAAARIRRGSADEAAQQLLPSIGGGVEMTSMTLDPFGRSGAVRRRARVLERLDSLDPHGHGQIDRQQLVGALPGPEKPVSCRAHVTSDFA